jgi:DNA topoisomerase II
MLRFSSRSIIPKLLSRTQKHQLFATKKASTDFKQRYEKKTPLEHVLLRPGMYIGQTESSNMQTWVYQADSRTMEKTTVTYNPALLKLFDEILVNAADQTQRDKNMSKIEINVTHLSSGALEVSVLNDGSVGIPIDLHPTENIHIPELIFGHLLTGSNFNDSEIRLTGGSHGYGAKLTNIFSNKFEVEIYDAEEKKLYTQTWSKNMHEVHPPTIVDVPYGASKTAPNRGLGYTKITYRPDLFRFDRQLSTGLTDAADSTATTASKKSTKAAVAAAVASAGNRPTSDSEHDARLVEQCVQMMHRRAVDVAACIAPVKVSFSFSSAFTGSAPGNSENPSREKDILKGKIHTTSLTPIAMNSFQDYVSLFSAPTALVGEAESARDLPSVEVSRVGGAVATGFESVPDADTITVGVPPPLYAKINKRWEVAVGLSPTSSFEQMSFVNNVWTTRGGTHVNVIATQVQQVVLAALHKRGFKSTTNNQIKNKLLIFVNCLIENPAFDGQTKDALNSKPSTFGTVCTLPEKYLQELVRSSGIVESIISDLASKENGRVVFSKASRKQLLDVPKLEDAHNAGGPHGADCTLILTEGDSAKALAVAGLEVVGREKFGVLPLRGKLLNVRSASLSMTKNNKEIQHLMRALGLQFPMKYETQKEKATLRYGKVLIMCDQDSDGSHIKGLVVNLFHHFWPALIKEEGYLQQFLTPLVKVRTKSKSQAASFDESFGGAVNKDGSISFYSIPEFKQWLKDHDPAGKNAIIAGVEGITFSVIRSFLVIVFFF